MDPFELTTPRTEPAAEVDKSQYMRLLDVFVLGPFMVAYALSDRPSPLLRVALGGIGLGTILYNANNYRKTQAAREY